MRTAVIRCLQCIWHAAKTAKTGLVQLAPALTVKRAAYKPYALPLKSQLTTGRADCARRGFLLQLTCSLPDGSQAHGVGEIAPLAGLLAALQFRISRSSACLVLAILLMSQGGFSRSHGCVHTVHALEVNQLHSFTVCLLHAPFLSQGYMTATAGLHRESLLEAEEQLAMLAVQLHGAVVPASLALLQVQAQKHHCRCI